MNLVQSPFESFAVSEISFENPVSDDDTSEHKSTDLQTECDKSSVKNSMTGIAEDKKEMDLLLRAMLLVDDKVSLKEKSSQELMDAVECLMKGSVRFVISELWMKAQTLVTNAIQVKPSNSVMSLKIFKAHPVLADSCAERLALETICRDPKLLLDNDSLVVLDRSIIKDILKSNKVGADESTLFRMLKSWLDMDEKRIRDAAEFVKYIPLKSICIDDLLSLEESGLVTKDCLYDAFKAQAISSSKAGNNLMKSHQKKSTNTSKRVLNKQCKCPSCGSSVRTSNRHMEGMDDEFAKPDDSFWNCDLCMLQNCKDAILSVRTRKFHELQLGGRAT
mmetsp:Transcript_26648/g.39419  ORF Transcript_26648/g.39419 Transcript_26648/m.39419 type:complete len:334 (+) Transcript_26648:60-1061(+)